MQRSYSLVLLFLSLAFFLRVLGQFLVAMFHVDFLPPMPAWYSGLVPYPVLLPTQLVILALQAKISHDIWHGTGYFAAYRPHGGRMLRWFSLIYFAVMLARYVLTMWLDPERRWLGGTIPIFFHGVLALYLFVLASYQLSPNRYGRAGVTFTGSDRR